MSVEHWWCSTDKGKPKYWSTATLSTTTPKQTGLRLHPDATATEWKVTSAFMEQQSNKRNLKFCRSEHSSQQSKSPHPVIPVDGIPKTITDAINILII
jgi:hypothetical protein